VVVNITDELEDWAHVDKVLPTENRGLLIGNGASINVWPRFRYPSLYEIAKDERKANHLTRPEVNLFADLNTTNFESVLSAMIAAGKVWKIYGKPRRDIADLDESYERVRKSLIRAVKEVHVPFKQVSKQLKAHLEQAIAAYSDVYSTNYDLVLYWSMMNNPARFKDFMWGEAQGERSNLFDISDTEVRNQNTATTNVLFLHGALHLYKYSGGRTFKKTWGVDGNLLDQFDVQPDDIPLFISEGTSRDKLSAILRNDYLSFAYERFSKHPGCLVVFGHSLTPEYDQHLLDALRRRQCASSDGVVAVSVPPDRDSLDVISLKNRLMKDLPGYQVRFFNSRTHPLGEDGCQITQEGLP
jgi:hypothetical protein